jgi:putative ABC transport system substrate-binding protein
MTIIQRRDFITVLGGAAAWPLAARAQQGERVRRVGVLMMGDENDPQWKPGLSAFTQSLAGLGWTDSRNVRIDLRWTGAFLKIPRKIFRSPYALKYFFILPKNWKNLRVTSKYIV